MPVASHQRVGKQMQKRVAEHGSDGKCHQKLNQMLVEDLLHDGYDEDAEESAQRDEHDGRRGRQPQPIVVGV